MKKVNDYATWHVIAQYLFERFRIHFYESNCANLSGIFFWCTLNIRGGTQDDNIQ